MNNQRGKNKKHKRKKKMTSENRDNKKKIRYITVRK